MTRRFALLAALAGLTACTTPGTATTAAISPCANIDWYESGRADGLTGATLDRLKSHQQRCDTSDAPVEADMYLNGREAGLIDFCTTTGGLEAGKGGLVYEKVCPEHLEASFLSAYRLGQRIRVLEGEHEDLQSRIENLTDLLSPSQPGGSVRAQIDQLKARRAQIDTQITTLEDQANGSQDL